MTAPSVPRNPISIRTALTADLSAHPRRLVIEADRLYHMLCVLSKIAIGTPDWPRVHRVVLRAADRSLRRLMNTACDTCGRPATRCKEVEDGVYAHHCAACAQEVSRG